jgi:Retrotransposon gag protein
MDLGTDPSVRAEVQGEGAVGAAGNAREETAALQLQLAAMQQMIQQQAQQMQQQIQELRASPGHSPQESPLASPMASPRQEVPAAVAAPAGEAQQSRFARKEPRAQDLREYDGAPGAKLDEWLDELGAAVDLFHLNEREAVDFGMSRLRGAARQWWNALGSAGRAGIECSVSLARALRARFQPVTTERVAREQMRSLRQNNRGVNEYIAEFQRLRAIIPDMSEADALFAFESGLQPMLALELRKAASTKLTDALALAARVGGITEAASASSSQGRSAPAASAHQMDVSEGVEERITRSVLNALQMQNSGAPTGFGAKTQTQRSYQQDRRGRGRSGGSAGSRFGEQRSLPPVPGVSAAVVEQRRTAGQCYRCGSVDHTRFECPNATSSHSTN